MNKVIEAMQRNAAVCRKCKTKNRCGALYCGCGTALNNECSNCGTRNLVTEKNCVKCQSNL